MISRLNEQFLRNDSQGSEEGSRDKFQTLKYEHIIYRFEARDLKISNM